MSTPLRVYDPAFEGARCCDELIPVPAWWILRMGKEVPGLNASARGKASAIGDQISDELAKRLFDPPSAAEIYYCRACSTALEDARDAVAAAWDDARLAVGIVLKAVATVVSFVPGIGTAAASVLSGAGSLAMGKSISDAALDAAAAAIPGGAAVQAVFQAGRDVGGALIDGQSIDDALLEGARGQARLHGGELGAAAFDAALILARGKALQDAGFAVLRGFAKGNTLAERSVDFAEKAARAAVNGQPIEDLLVDELGAEVRRAAGAEAADRLAPVLERVALDPSLRELGSQAFAFAEAVPEPIARAAQALVRDDGTIDQRALDRMLGIGASASMLARWSDQRGLLSRVATITEAKAEAARQRMLMMVTADPSQKFAAPSLASRLAGPGAAAILSADAVGKIGTPRTTTAVVASTAPPSRSSAGENVLLGVTVAGALAALYLWASHGRRA